MKAFRHRFIAPTLYYWRSQGGLEIDLGRLQIAAKPEQLTAQQCLMNKNRALKGLRSRFFVQNRHFNDRTSKKQHMGVDYAKSDPVS